MENKDCAKVAYIMNRRYERENIGYFLLFWEALLLSAFLGFRYDSWTVFGLILIGMLFLSWIRPLAYIVSIAFSTGWSIIGVVIGMGFLQSSLFAVIFATIAILIAIRLHFEVYRIA